MLIEQTWHSDRVMWMTMMFVPLRATQKERWVTTGQVNIYVGTMGRPKGEEAAKPRRGPKAVL